MKANQLIETVLDRLYATNDTKKIVGYFAPYLKVTRQQLSAWRKTGKYPAEILQACFEQEIDLDDSPTVAVAQDRTNARETGPQVVTEPEPTSEFIDAQTEETQTGNLLGEGYTPRNPKTGMPVNFAQPVRVAGKRHNDIRVREAGERGRSPDPELIEPPVTDMEAAIAQGVELALRRLGIAPNGRPEGPQTIQQTKLRGRMGDDWNTPRRRPMIVQQ